MNSAFPWFVNPCLETFQFLESRYSFAPPEIEQLGRECYIRYRKGNRWVSVAYEPGSVPIVELFHPSRDMKDRRIPRLKHGLSKPRAFADTDEQQQRWTLQAQAEDLETTESSFLSASSE
jgi:hypothetical protein